MTHPSKDLIYAIDVIKSYVDRIGDLELIDTFNTLKDELLEGVDPSKQPQCRSYFEGAFDYFDEVCSPALRAKFHAFELNIVEALRAQEIRKANTRISNLTIANANVEPEDFKYLKTVQILHVAINEELTRRCFEIASDNVMGDDLYMYVPSDFIFSKFRIGFTRSAITSVISELEIFEGHIPEEIANFARSDFQFSFGVCFEQYVSDENQPLLKFTDENSVDLFPIIKDITCLKKIFKALNIPYTADYWGQTGGYVTLGSDELDEDDFASFDIPNFSEMTFKQRFLNYSRPAHFFCSFPWLDKALTNDCITRNVSHYYLTESHCFDHQCEWDESLFEKMHNTNDEAGKQMIFKSVVKELELLEILYGLKECDSTECDLRDSRGRLVEEKVMKLVERSNMPPSKKSKTMT